MKVFNKLSNFNISECVARGKSISLYLEILMSILFFIYNVKRFNDMYLVIHRHALE